MKKGGGSAVKELLLELAEAVQHAVAELVEDPAEVVGRGADGAPSTRIDRVAEAAVLRVLDYEDARLNVLSEEAGFIDRAETRPWSSTRSMAPTTPSEGCRHTRSPWRSADRISRTSRKGS